MYKNSDTKCIVRVIKLNTLKLFAILVSSITFLFIKFFKGCCEVLEEDEENPAEIKCEMVKRGYMDDPWNTDQAWKEVELWHVHFTGNEMLSQSFSVMFISSLIFLEHWNIVNPNFQNFLIF